jgi:hypothetical protein
MATSEQRQNRIADSFSKLPNELIEDILLYVTAPDALGYNGNVYGLLEPHLALQFRLVSHTFHSLGWKAFAEVLRPTIFNILFRQSVETW